jgi:hypothetical protein
MCVRPGPVANDALVRLWVDYGEVQEFNAEVVAV